jgi:hypothetical protein
VLAACSRKWSSMTVPFIRKNTQRNSSWPGDSTLHQRQNTFAQICRSTLRFSLAVRRQSIHCRESHVNIRMQGWVGSRYASRLHEIRPIFLGVDALLVGVMILRTGEEVKQRGTRNDGYPQENKTLRLCQPGIASVINRWPRVLGFLREHRGGTPACPEGHQ